MLDHAQDTFSDAELTELALAADIDLPLAPDAVPFPGTLAEGSAFSPAWYMPAPATNSARRRPVVIAAIVILSLLVINALGLCVTYGSVVVA